MTQYGFYFDGTRCTGCKCCVAACRDYHDLDANYAFRQVYEYGGGTWEKDLKGIWTNNAYVYYVSNACNHCADPACVANCPQGSMKKDPDTGLVFNNPETCIGCSTCADTCPYGAPVVDTEKKISVKCDGCAARVAAGGKPICVEACPLRALEFGPIDELRAKYGTNANIAPLADPSITNPSITIKANSHAVAFDDTTGSLLNKRELVR